MGEKERSLLYGMSRVQAGKVVGFDSAVSGVDQALAVGETPCAAVWGKFPNGRFGLLVATDLRVIGFNKGVFTGKVDVDEIPYDMIKSVNHKLGWVVGEITILTFPSGGLHVGTVNKEAVSVFANWVRDRVGARGGDSKMGRGEHTTVASLGGVKQSLADELTKLAALRDSGVLSEAELLKTKERLLNR